MRILHFLKRIKRSFSNSNPLIRVLISKGNLIGNLNEYKRKYPKIGFAPVLKSNAYGHGLIEIAKIFDREEKPFFVADSLFEARILRENDIKSDILIIGYTSPENMTHSKLPNVAFTLTSLGQLEILSETKHKVKIHIKIDTGMHRQGILPNEIRETIRVIKNNSNIILEGICSHLADADNQDISFTEEQIKKWNNAVKIFKENFDGIKYFHLSATSGTKYLEKTDANVARLGIGLYGAIEENSLNLKPVLEMQTIISSVKNISAGQGVGYNLTYKTPKTLMVATVPVGYFEGVDRRLSNCGFFKIGNNFCPIIGRVSMNITSIDVTDAGAVKEGDKVVVISNNPSDKNSVLNIAKTTSTISYEIIVHIPQHLKRIVVE